MYPDYFEERVTCDRFEVVLLRSPAGEYKKSADGIVRKLSGLDREALVALSYVFNYAYLIDMSLPLIPECENDPRVFTMDTGANFGTKITLNSETNLIDSVSLKTGSGELLVSFCDYAPTNGLKIPRRMVFSGTTDMEVNDISIKINTSPAPRDFAPLAETPHVPAKTEAFSIPLKSKDGLFFVEGTLGKKPVRFLFDTAWGELPVAKAAESASMGEMPFLARFTSTESTLFISTPADITFLSGAFGMRSPVFIAEKIREFTGENTGIDAAIGHTLIALYPVTVDLARGELIFFPAKSFFPPKDVKKIRLTVDGGRPLVIGSVDGRCGMFVLDSTHPGFGSLLDIPTNEISKSGVKIINIGGIVFDNETLGFAPKMPSYPDNAIGVLGGRDSLKNSPSPSTMKNGILYLEKREGLLP